MTLTAPATTRAGIVPGLDRIAFGGDYNPEQWPREVWDDDIKLMTEIGVNLVSVGIFSWVLLEPREGQFDFAWLDDVFDRLHAAGIGVSLGTPTASPPAWFWKQHPDARPVTRDGIPLGFGSRGMMSPSAPAYAAACERIVTALAERYGTHPALRLWHVHNEYGAPVSESYDTHSVDAFRVWLAKRYGTLEHLNDAWGTAFWGQRYGEWDEIDAPRRAATTVNPAQRLDFARFTSDALLACFVRERDILHRLSPGIPVTTNFMATSCPAMDYWKWAREVDIVSNDHYLTGERRDAHVLLAMDADMTRSLAAGKPWLLMEHSTSAVNWQDRNIAKRPGELERNSLSHWARGADGILFFQWRASRSGAEKFHSAIVPHQGAQSRIFTEAAELGRHLGDLRDALGTRVHARAAILWDWESFWAQDLEWRPSKDLSHRRQIENYYTWLWQLGLTVDFAHPEADLASYDLVLAPSLYLMSEAAAANVESFVRAGGTLIAGYFSGIVGVHDNVPAAPLPHGLSAVLGLSIDEFAPLRSGETADLSNGLSGTVWTDLLTATSARTIATYTTGPAAGGAAITRNTLGAGSAWYVSTELDPDGLASALAPALEDARIRADSAREPQLEHITRLGDDVAYEVYLNHTDRTLRLQTDGTDAVSGEPVGGETEIAAGGTRIIRHPIQ
ncbi:beta-galactosidase [Curtobacterium ammoniigenes]|uniref:beta-galactosidase n=1 Tax=Curtobacterium ammoniigenes TaxID=395387 RepID=UPI0008334D5F|nr:beta-galactosidase [Curtobacterium ammoniigenes]